MGHGVCQDSCHHPQGHIRHIVVRTPSVRPAGIVGRRVAAGIVGERAQSLLAGSLSRWDVQVDSQELGQRFIGFAGAAHRWPRRIAEQGVHEVFTICRREAGTEHCIERRRERRVAVERDEVILVFGICGIPPVLHVRRDDQLIDEGIPHARHLDEAGAVVPIAVLPDDAHFRPARAGIGAEEFVAIRAYELADGNFQRDRVDVEAAERIGGAGARRSDDDGVVGIVGIGQNRRNMQIQRVERAS